MSGNKRAARRRAERQAPLPGGLIDLGQQAAARRDKQSCVVCKVQFSEAHLPEIAVVMALVDIPPLFSWMRDILTMPAVLHSRLCELAGAANPSAKISMSAETKQQTELLDRFLEYYEGRASLIGSTRASSGIDLSLVPGLAHTKTHTKVIPAASFTRSTAPTVTNASTAVQRRAGRFSAQRWSRAFLINRNSSLSNQGRG